MADLLVEARVQTCDPARPTAQAVLVRGGRIAAVGDVATCEREARKGARRLRAGSAVPGLADAHGHLFLLGRQRSEIRLADAKSEEDCAFRVQDRARAMPLGHWIRGAGWDETRWTGGRLPTASSLSRAAPGHPVLLERVDRHLAWVNAAALAAARIGPTTPDPPGGKIVRGADGKPTGILVDAAQDVVLACIPAPSRREIEAALRAALEEVVALGLTEIHDAGVGPEVLEVLRALAEADRLPVRVYAMIDGQVSFAELRERMRSWAPGREVGRLRVRAVKLFADGALGSHGAALLEDYADAPGNRGLLLLTPEELRARIATVVAAGLQPAIHAIGDRAVAEVLDALETAAEPAAIRAVRPRIEHLQVVRSRDLARLAAIGGVASMQPLHLAGDGAWVASRLGGATDRLRRAYAWRSVIDAGIPLAFGSDFPVESPDPREGVAAAELRVPRGAEVPLAPAERLGRAEALRAYTAGPAWASFAEVRRGRIAEGLDGDLTLFAGDVDGASSGELRTMPVTHTIVGGRVEWSAEGGGGGDD